MNDNELYIHYRSGYYFFYIGNRMVAIQTTATNNYGLKKYER